MKHNINLVKPKENINTLTRQYHEYHDILIYQYQSHITSFDFCLYQRCNTPYMRYIWQTISLENWDVLHIGTHLVWRTMQY